MQNRPAGPTQIRWAVFGLSCATSWLLYLHRYTFALIKPELAKQYQLGKEQLGLLDSAFSFFYSLFQFPLGVVADLWGVRLVLTGMLLLGSLGLAMHAAVGGASHLWYARVTLGVGQSAVYATLNRISRYWFPPRVRTTLQGIVGILAGRVGGLSAYLFFGFLLLGVLKLDWRNAVYVMSGVGFLFAIVFFLVFRNSPSDHPWVNSAEAALIRGDANSGATTNDTNNTNPANVAPRMTVRQLLRSVNRRGMVNLVALNVQTVLSTFADNIYSNWIPLFLWEVHALEFKEMGIYSSLPLLGGAAAGAIGGALNDACVAWTGNRRWARSGVAIAGKTAAAILLTAALVWYDRPYLFCVALMFVKFFSDWSLSSSWGVVTDIGGRATASVFAFNNAIAGIGSVLAPALFGFLAAWYGWRAVFLTTSVAYLLCAASWLVINSGIPIVDDDPVESS